MSSVRKRKKKKKDKIFCWASLSHLENRLSGRLGLLYLLTTGPDVVTCCRQGLSHLQSTGRGFLGPRNQGFLPLTECTSRLDPDFKQKRKSIKVLTKGLPHIEKVGLDSGASRDPPSRVFAPPSNSWPCGPHCPCLGPCFYKNLNWIQPPLISPPCRSYLSPGPGFPGLRSLLDPTLTGLHEGTAWTIPGCENSVGLGATWLETKKDPFLQSTSPDY